MSQRLVDIDHLVAAYYDERPDPSVGEQRVAFGTSGHRGTSPAATFNEAHVLAISEAVCRYRAAHGIRGPLFLGRDSHALSEPASRTALEVLAAHGVDVVVDAADGYVPTPVVSHAILTHNRRRPAPRADGIVLTPSHNPPEDGGFKYNPPHGGPAGTDVTTWIEREANALLEARLEGMRRVPLQRAATLHRRDYVTAHVDDLPSVVDLEAIRASGLRLGVDPLGGASLAYWEALADRHGLDLSVVDDTIDPTFHFVPAGSDGRIRMDCSSPHAMARLTDRKGDFDAEMTARAGKDPDELYRELTERFGAPVYRRVDVAATPREKAALRGLSPEHVRATGLAGEPIRAVLTTAPGNGAPIGGVKVVAEHGWFAARPSGTEDVYKIYAESELGAEHLERILAEARSVVDGALATAGATV